MCLNKVECRTDSRTTKVLCFQKKQIHHMHALIAWREDLLGLLDYFFFNSNQNSWEQPSTLGIQADLKEG